MLGVYLRYIHGPVLTAGPRSLLSLALVMAAICVWELVEGLIRQISAYSSSTLMIVYWSMFGAALICGIGFEYATNHDLIGNHLLF